VRLPSDGDEDILNSIWLNRLDFEGRLLGEDRELGQLIWDYPLVYDYGWFVLVQ